ncbi:MAG: MFS transporter [Dehalococcoidales bacterium]|nr:MFS transporter [Dehalococcoidales bacterium]
MKDDYRSKYRWYMLALLAVTGTFVTAIPFSCMPVLFPEIADELGLNVTQLGTIWGMGNLAGIFVSLIGGILGDRFSSKWILTIACILVGVTGALRGLSSDFLFLSITMFVNGVIRLVIPVTITRTVGLWFKGRNLGMGQGISAMGMGLGLSLGPMLSATWVSPMVDGWRNVLFIYGGLSAFIGILWLIFGKEPPVDEDLSKPEQREPLLKTLSRLVRIKALWFVGLTFTLRMGSMMGMTGYLPYYLEESMGWSKVLAGGSLSAFYAISTLCVVPLTALSDRIGTRKLILMLGIITNTINLALLPLADGWIVWILLLLAGIFMDGFMAINTTTLLESKGIESRYSGTALGMIFTIGHIGSISSPPIGNSFAGIHPGLPFTFWAVLSVLGLVMLVFVKETGWRKKMFGKATHPDLL